MAEHNQVKKPLSEILFRQCSIETHSPSQLLQEEEPVKDNNRDTPKIIDLKKKQEVSVSITEEKKSKPILSPKPKTASPNFEKDFRKTTPKVSAIKENNSKPILSPKPKTDFPNFKNLNEEDETFKSEKNNGTSNVLQSKLPSQFTNELNKKLEGHLRKTPEKTARTKTVVDNSNSQNTITKNVRQCIEENDLRKSIVCDLKDQLNVKEHIGLISDRELHATPANVNQNENDLDEKCEASFNKGIIERKNDTPMVDMKTDNDSEKLSVGLLKGNHQKKNNQEKDECTVGGVYQKKGDMATLRPKSPRPVPLKGEKEETIWDKLGTLGRKKRIKEVQEVQAEGKYAIDSPGCPTAPIIPPEDYNLEDNEERCMIDPNAYNDPRFSELLNVLKEWINDELASQRIIVQDLSEDLYDGQVLQKLLEKLTGDKFDVPEVTQSEEGQKQKLMVVLDHFNKVLGIQRITHNKWNVESIHSKNIVAITHLLVALARHFRPPVRLPEHVSVEVVVVQKASGRLIHKTVRESLTKEYDDVGMRCERDAFDTLFDHAPDKLQVVKKSLVTFVNKHLNKMNFEITEIETQFHDGVYLIMLMGLLEGFFVPHYIFHLTPHEFEQKVHNVSFAFELMEEVGLPKPKARPEDVVNMDLKSTLRVLYNLFLRYRTIL